MLLTLADALAAAKRLAETFDDLGTGSDQKVRQIRDQDETSNPLVTSLEKKLQKQLDELRTELDGMKLEKARVAQPKPSPRPYRPYRRDGGEGTCFNCKQPGHRFRECPEPLNERLKSLKEKPFRRQVRRSTTRSEEYEEDQSLNDDSQ